MKRLMILLAPAALLGACENVHEPVVLPPFGGAVRHNMEVQIVPPAPAVGLPPTPAARQEVAFERYRTGAPQTLPTVSTTTVTTAAE